MRIFALAMLLFVSWGAVAEPVAEDNAFKAHMRTDKLMFDSIGHQLKTHSEMLLYEDARINALELHAKDTGTTSSDQFYQGQRIDQLEQRIKALEERIQLLQSSRW